MSERFRYAINAVETTDLVVLAKFLTGAVQECRIENQVAHLDPAVRLICHQISFSGNGESVPPQYDKLVQFCFKKAATGPNYEFIQEVEKNVETPVPQAS